jgi:hypothetical protein
MRDDQSGSSNQTRPAFLCTTGDKAADAAIGASSPPHRNSTPGQSGSNTKIADGLGLGGVAHAITAAVYYATGVRVRELPVKIEKLLY